MSLISAIAIYFVLWWLVLFLVLPFGVGDREPDDELLLGTDRGAPVRTNLGKKVIATSVIAAILFAGIYVAIVVYGVTLEDLII